MGMTFSIYINPKYQGVPFHELSEEDQKFMNQLSKERGDDDANEIFYAGKNWDMLNFFREIIHVIEDDKENAQVYLSIDYDNVQHVLKKIKERIDFLLKNSDLYDEKTYEEGNDLRAWVRAYTAIKKFHEKNVWNESYLLVDAGW